MSRFKTTHNRDVPGLNLAALPDLIFTVLFFFMIVTHMRDVEKRVNYQVPAGTEVEKAQHKSAVIHIYIGKPTDASSQAKPATASASDEYCIQLNNELATVDDIARFVEAERKRMSAEDQERMTVSIDADRDVPMSVVNDVKQALRKSYALNVSYAASELRKKQ